MSGISSLWPFPLLSKRHHDPPQQPQDVQQPSAECSSVTGCPHMAENPFPWLELGEGPRESVSSMVPAPVQLDGVQLDSACNMYGESIVLIPTDEENVAPTEGKPGRVSHAASVSPELIDAQPVFVAARPSSSARDIPAGAQGPCMSPQPVRSAITAATYPDLVASVPEALPQQEPGCLAWPPPAHACEPAGISIKATPAAAAVHTAAMQGRQPHLDHDSAKILHGSTSQGRVQSARSQYCKTVVEAFQLSLPGVPRTRVKDAFLRDDSCHMGAASRGMHITFQVSPPSRDQLAWQLFSVTHAKDTSSGVIAVRDMRVSLRASAGRGEFLHKARQVGPAALGEPQSRTLLKCGMTPPSREASCWIQGKGLQLAGCVLCCQGSEKQAQQADHPARRVRLLQPRRDGGCHGSQRLR